MKRIVKRTIFIVFVLAFLGFLSTVFMGCTPQSVKKSGALNEQAVVYAKTKASNVVTTFERSDDETLRTFAGIINHDIVSPLEEAAAFMKPVMKIIGYPKDLDVYIPGAPENERLANRAMTEAKLATLIEDAFAKFAKNKLPDALGKYIPDPVADKVSWEGILAMIAAVITGYGGTKLSGKGIAKILNKGKTNA